ncbi:MAG: DUF2953 domain-containing protein, partial [Eubacteriales bacterium]
MVGLGFYIIVLAAFLITAMFLRVRFFVAYKRKASDDRLKIEMTLLKGLVKYKTEVPVVDLDRFFLDPILKVEADIEGVVSEPVEDKGMIVKVPISLILRRFPLLLSQGLDYLSRYKMVLKRLLKAVRCHNLEWTTEIGLGDPAGTGIATGLLWGVKSLLYGKFRSSVGTMIKPPSFSVIPSFNCLCLRLDFNC